jgi:hypothetical protein
MVLNGIYARDMSTQTIMIDRSNNDNRAVEADVVPYLFTYSIHPRAIRIVVYVTLRSSIFPIRVSNALARSHDSFGTGSPSRRGSRNANTRVSVFCGVVPWWGRGAGSELSWL